MSDYTDPAEDLAPGAPMAGAAFAESAASVPALPAFDAAKYRTHIEPFGLTDVQKRELLETLWAIMYSFVEIGFSTDVCALVFDDPEIVADDQADAVDSPYSTFAEASHNPAEEGPV